MLGFMSAQEAKLQGFTNHGSYYGIPVWVSYEDGGGLNVATKWAPMELLMTAAHHIEALLKSLHRDPTEGHFTFKVGPPIA